MPDEVFISYARSDREKVMPVVDILRGTGISVWVDEAKIDAATLWSEEIVDAINNCKDMVVMLASENKRKTFQFTFSLLRSSANMATRRVQN